MEDWLRSVGLDRYVPAFREQGILIDHLATLTDADLRELGLSIGDRKRFRAGLSAAPPGGTAERRPLTVMFVDLVGSSALAERLDVEDFMDLVRQYRDRCGEAIARYGGKIAHFIGDGILAYFCWPVANENDPERAGRAALEIVRAMTGLNAVDGEPVHIRIGLATGVVIVGDVIAGGERETHGVLGSTPNLAARLQELAPTDGIVISQQTYDRVRPRFDCERMTPVPLRGFAEAQQPWRILGEKGSRGAASHLLGGTEATKLMGRDAERETLRDLWRAAEQATARIGLVIGEAGIGKSRLIERFLNEDLSTGAELIEIHGSAFDTDSPLRPFIDLLQPEAASLQLSDATDEDQAILAALVGLPHAESVVVKLTPEQLRQRTIALLARHVAGRAGAARCIVVEDLHWFDPSSREVLGLLARLIEGRRRLLLLAGREGIDPSFLPGDTAILRLGPLGPDATAGMVRDLLGDRPISADLLDQIAKRTDGVPLFIEEITRALREHAPGALSEQRLNGEAGRHIPASLHESLMARLDRAGAAKHIAHAAAVAGRSVRRDILAEIGNLTPEELDRSLATLVAAGVLERDLRASEETYGFSHALLRDAAYDSLLREPQRALHEKVARALQRLQPEIATRQPEILAAHLTAAARAIEAAPLWLEAARSSLARSALTEAARLLQRGLSALERLPPTGETRRLRLQLSGPLGAALMGLHGAFAAETQRHYAAAYELCRELPEDDTHFPIYWGWWRVAPDYRAHLERASSLLERAEAREAPALLLQAHHCSWAINFHLGALERCREHMRAGLAIYEAGDYRQHAQLYGNHDAKVCAHGGLCQLYWMQGKLRSAEREEAACLGWADQIDHLGSRVHALGLTLLYRAYRRDLDAVAARANELFAVTTEYGLKEYQAAATIFNGWVRAARGEPAQGLAMIEEGFARQREVASTEDFPVYLCLMAEPLVALGRAEEAVERMTAERAALDAIGLRLWMPELIRTTAETMLIASPSAVDGASRMFDEADDMATTQGVHMLRLRVARSRLRLADRLAGSDTGPAIRRLGQALDAIPEPDDSAELIEARKVLDVAVAPPG